MFPFLLYLITGLATGGSILIFLFYTGVTHDPLPIYTLMLESAAFAGALYLLWAARVAFSEPRKLLLPIFFSSLGLLFFYAYAFWTNFQHIAPPEWGLAAIMILPQPLLLAFTIFYSGYGMLAGEQASAQPRWLYPENLGEAAKKRIIGVALVVGLTLWATVGVTTRVVHEMTWTHGPEGETKLVFTKYPNRWEVFRSEELQLYLDSYESNTVPVAFNVLYNFGSVEGITVISVGSWRPKPGDWETRGMSGTPPVRDDPW